MSIEPSDLDAPFSLADSGPLNHFIKFWTLIVSEEQVKLMIDKQGQKGIHKSQKAYTSNTVTDWQSVQLSVRRLWGIGIY